MSNSFHFFFFSFVIIIIIIFCTLFIFIYHLIMSWLFIYSLAFTLSNRITQHHSIHYNYKIKNERQHLIRQINTFFYFNYLWRQIVFSFITVTND